MKPNYVILFFALLLGSMSSSVAQDLQSHKKIETDVSLSPRVGTILYHAEVISADITVRYKFSDNFSAGLGLNPTCLDYSYDAICYVPVCISLRYGLLTGKQVSPYFLLNVGGSFIQLEPDPAFQGRFAIGADINVSDNISLFSEIGIAYFERTLWSPFTLGIRF